MKKNLLLHSILTWCVMLFAVVGFAQINTNGGFESWTGTWPDGWHGSKTNIVADNVVKVTSGAHSGDNACQLINNTNSLKRFTMQPVSVTVGEQYLVSFWVKGHGDVRIGVYNGPTSSDGYIYNSYHNINSAQYVYCVDTVTITNSLTNAEFIVAVKNTVADDNNIIIDDVSVTAIVSGDFVAEPTATVSGNMFSTDTYFSTATVSLGCATTGASIYYTLDGTEPTAASTLYTSPITITETTTLKAIAELNGNSSTVLTKTITILNLTPLFYENFETNGLNQMTATNVSGTHSWASASYNGNHYAIANAYNQGACETWLITPVITPLNAGGVVMSFESATKFNGPALQVKYSTNYSGSGSPATATWTDITDEFVFSTGNNWIWANSGDLEIYGADPICFAWVYTSTETSAAGWEIDNIMVLPGESQVLTPTLTVTEPANGAVYSTLDTLHIGLNVQNFVLGTDGYIKVESNFLDAMGLGMMNPVYIDQNLFAMIAMMPLNPLPAGSFTFTASLVGMDSVAITPAVSVTSSFTVVAPVLDAPVVTAAGDEAASENTYYFNATVTMTAAEGASIYYTTDGSVPTDSSTLYIAPFQITETATIKAIAVMENYQNSAVTTLDVTITAPTVATPVFTPGTGTYADSVAFSIACATEGAEIRYTIDGTEPTETSALYTTPIMLSTTTTVKAKAFKATWYASETATAVYTVVFEPVLTVDATTLNFTSTQLTQTFTVSGAHLDNPIALSCSSTHFTLNPTTITTPNSNTVVTVTFDGTEPATGTVSVTSGTLNAQVALTATAQLPAPVLTPATGNDTLVTVAMNCTVAGAEIRYTTDGTEPTVTSTLYTAPVVLNIPGTYTLKAMAVKADWENSEVMTGTYVINEPPAPDTVAIPVITPATDTYYAPQTVTITCTDADAVIRYTTDGTEPTEASTLYSAPFTVTTNTTITAKAWKAGMIPSGTASVTISFPDQVANIAAFKAAAATNVEKQIMSDVTFVFRSGRFMYVEDNTAAMLIYDYNTPVITTQYNEGDVIEGGIFGKYTLYQGMVEMLPTHNANAATGTPVTVTPATATISDIKTQYTDVYEARLVHLSDVQFINATQFVQNGDTMAIYNRFNTVTTTIAAGDLADVTGFVSYSTNYGYQIYPRDNNDIDIHPVVVLDTVATPEFFFQRDGEFYRMYLTCATEGASIYYSIDGTDPDENSLAYTDAVPFYLNVHYVIKAIAMKEGMENSEIAVYDYDPAGLPTIDMDDPLMVYPNPASDRVFIHFESKSINFEKIELYNAYGQLVKVVDVNSAVVEIPVSTLASGTYFAKIFTEQGIVGTRPVIRK